MNSNVKRFVLICGFGLLWVSAASAVEIKGVACDLAGNALQGLKNGTVTVTIGMTGAGGVKEFAIDAAGNFSATINDSDFDPKDRFVNIDVSADGRGSACLKSIALHNQTIDVVMPEVRCYGYWVRCGRCCYWCESTCMVPLTDSATNGETVPAGTKKDVSSQPKSTNIAAARTKQQADSFRLWTNRAGTQQVRAKLQSVDNDRAMFEREDGRIATVVISNLIDIDQAWIKQWQIHTSLAANRITPSPRTAK